MTSMAPMALILLLTTAPDAGAEAQSAAETIRSTVVIYVNPLPQASEMPPLSEEGQALVERFLGRYPVEDVRERTLRQLLNESRGLEAAFNSFEARVKRSAVLRTYGAAVRVTPKLVKLAARSLQEEYSVLLTGGSGRRGKTRKQAHDVASTMLRRFPEVQFERRDFRPDVIEEFEATKAKTSIRETGTLIVSASSSVLFADGRSLGPVDGQARFELPVGEYRVWATRGERLSIARRVVIGTEPVSVRFDIDVEERLGVVEGLTFQCNRDCDDLLARLGGLLGVSSLLVVGRVDDAQGQPLVAERFDVVSRERTAIETDAPLTLTQWFSEGAPGLEVERDIERDEWYNQWWVWAAGAAIVGGTVTAFALASGGDEPATPSRGVSVDVSF